MLKELAEKYPESIAQLTYQYRMHADICQLSNDLAYGGKLKCANNEVAYKRLELNGSGKESDRILRLASSLWLTQTLDPRCAVKFLDTDSIRNNKAEFDSLEHTADSRVGGSIINQTEAEIVCAIVDEIIALGVSPTCIGIICPFKAQLRILEQCSSLVESKRLGLEISTIDRYQGRDKEVIILSFVRSNEKGKVGRLLQDHRRLNVAVSRAKCKLIMIGSFATLYKGSDALRPILDRVKSNNWILQLPQNVKKTC
jgi:DNA replication ATP-dependent helicase Dna2